MAKVVVIKDPDGQVHIIRTPEGKYSDEDLPNLPSVKEFVEVGGSFYRAGTTFYIANESSLPSKSGLESREQLYHDGSNEVKVDVNWENVVMPRHIILGKCRKRRVQEIKEESLKESPDVVKIARANAEMMSYEGLTEKEF